MDKNYIYKNGKISLFKIRQTTYNEKTYELWSVDDNSNKILKVDRLGETIDALKYNLPNVKNKLMIKATNKGDVFAVGDIEDIPYLYHKTTIAKQFKAIKLSSNSKRRVHLGNSLYIGNFLYFQYKNRLIKYNTKDLLERTLRQTMFDD